MGLDISLNGVYGLAIDLLAQLQGAGRRHSTPLPIGFMAQRFIIQLDLLRGFENSRRPVIGSKHIAGSMFVWGGKYIHPGVIGMGPGFIQAQKIFVGIEPAGRNRHSPIAVSADGRKNGWTSRINLSCACASEYFPMG